MGIGVYTRISFDIEDTGLGVARQEADCRKLADLRGWTIDQVYEDNDISAFKRNVVRPAFEQLLVDLKNKVIDGIVVYDLDRFARQNHDLERAIEIYDERATKAPATFATVQGDIDLSSADGRTMARVMVAFANKASMDTSRRVRRKHLELAQTGVPVGGNRAFGYEADKITPRPVEIKLIQQAVEDILNGVGLHTICRRWNEAGILTTKGNHWRKSVLKNLLLNPRLVGYRVYQGGIALQADGTPVKAAYDPVIDLETWESVCAILTDPSRTDAHTHRGGRKYLLSGIVRCGECGKVLHGQMHARVNRHYYVCKSPTSGGCGRVGISGIGLDELITELVQRHLADRRVEVLPEPFAGEAELLAAEEQINELMQAYRSKLLSADRVFPHIREIEDRMITLKTEKAKWRTEQSVKRPVVDALTGWSNMDVDQRRAVINSVLSMIIIARATRRGNRFDPTRATPVWR